MTRATLTGGAIAAGVVLFAFIASRFEKDFVPPPAPKPAVTSPAAEQAHPSFLYGRVTTVDGATYEGRLRWGGDQEAFWGDYFNGTKKANPWVPYVPVERLQMERHGFTFLGVEIGGGERPKDLDRLFMARFGDIARVDANVGDVKVILKSGTVFDLDRQGASDFDDGLRIWDKGGRIVNLDSLRIRTIELLPATRAGAAPQRLYGTVRTRDGVFTGFVQWDREECLGSDELDGNAADGERSLRFDTIRAIARRSEDSSLVTLLDGKEIELSGTNDVGRGHRGIYVNDPRFGRVLISWDAFERVDFSPGAIGPAYGDFPPGRPLTGAVTTRSGTHLAGRLVYDLDESESTETLDAPLQGVNYTIPFGLIASIALPGRDESGAPRARVTFHNGQELQLECSGDLGERNAGMLIFVEGRPGPEYLLWADVQRIDFDRPPAMYPPLDRH